jgi:acyl-CoA thioester hydrolase
MIDINYFSNRSVEARPNGKNGLGPQPVESSLNDQGCCVTGRGVVYPWHLDHMGHMNVRHYVAAFDEACWVLLALLGLDASYFKRYRRGMAALEQVIQYKSELQAGDGFEIRSRILEVRPKTIRIRHDMYKLRDGTLAASTNIIGVHIDAEARQGIALPDEVRSRACCLHASTTLPAVNGFAHLSRPRQVLQEARTQLPWPPCNSSDYGPDVADCRPARSCRARSSMVSPEKPGCGPPLFRRARKP